MSLIFVAVEGCTLDHGVGSLITGGTFVITGLLSPTCRGEGNQVYREKLVYTFSGGSHPSVDAGTVTSKGPQEIEPSAIKVRADGELVLRLGDSGTMLAAGTLSGTPVDVSGDVEIATAGQSTVRAE